MGGSHRQGGGAGASPVHHVHVAGAPLDAVVRVPGSKSIANRALVCATLAAGETVLTNVPSGDDTSVMLECAALLGAGVDRHADDRSTVRITGTDGRLHNGPLRLFTGLAGTTSRFVTALCALGDGSYEIDGLEPLRTRPMGPLHDALAALGVDVEPHEQPGHLPVTVRTGGVAAAGHGQRVVPIRGDVSSQYITALMLIAPYLAGGLRIELTTPLVSRPYLPITAAVMARFGVTDVTIGEDSVVVGEGRYTACEHAIEPDASSAGYPLAAAAICGGRVRVEGLRADSVQGDAGFADVLAAMGCIVHRDDSGTTVERRGELRGATIDMAHLSDLVPTLAVIAPFASSATEITGVGFIRAKESDRLGDLAAELGACGVRATVLDDGIRIEPGAGAGAAIDTHHDHRLAMAFGVLGMRLGGMRVHDPDVVSKSWPEFWSVLDAMHPAGVSHGDSGTRGTP